MEVLKITNLVETTPGNKDLFKKGSKFMVNKKNYSTNKEIRINTPMLRSDSHDLIILSIEHNSIV